MARQHGYKRLTRKARHLIRHLKRTRHASVQDQMVHELRHEVSRTHGFRGPKKAPDPGKAGRWRPLTRKAKQLLTRLRKAKVWRVQKQLVTELAREIERGRRRIDRARQAAVRGRARVRAGGGRVRAGAQRTRRAGARFRGRVRNGQEKLLTRAERKQAEREKRGPRKPGAVRRLRGAAQASARRARRRIRATWRYRHPGRARRTTPAPLRPRTARAQAPSVRPLRPVRAPRAPRVRRSPRARTAR